MNHKFDYVELMQRVERLSNSASDDQLRIYHQKITNLYRSLPNEHIDYRNLLHNIATKWHPQKKGIFFMDSVYRRVNTYEIETLLRREYPDPKDARNSIIAGIALFVFGAAILVASLSLMMLPELVAIGLIMTVTCALIGALGLAVGLFGTMLGWAMIASANEPYNNVKSLYETNEALNETIDSFEKDLLSDDLNKDKKSQQNDVRSEQEEDTSYQSALSAM